MHCSMLRSRDAGLHQGSRYRSLAHVDLNWIDETNVGGHIQCSRPGPAAPDLIGSILSSRLGRLVGFVGSPHFCNARRLPTTTLRAQPLTCSPSPSLSLARTLGDGNTGKGSSG